MKTSKTKVKAGQDLVLKFFRVLLRGVPEDLGVYIVARVPGEQKLRNIEVVNDPVRAARLVGELDARGEEAFVTPVLYPLDTENRKAVNCAGLLALTLDLDVAGAPMSDWSVKADGAPNVDSAISLASAVVEPTIMVLSGSGVHPWCLLSEPWIFDGGDDRRRANELFDAWQRAHRAKVDWPIDASTGGLPRVLRVPGTHNRKIRKERRVRVRATGHRHDRESLAEKVVEYVQVQDDFGAAELPDDLKLAEERLAEWQQHERFARVWFGDQSFESKSERDLALAKEILRLGGSDGEAAAAIGACRGDAKGRRRDYLERTVLRAREQVARERPRNATGSTPRLEKYDLRRMASTDPPDIAWVIEEFAARGEVTVLWGRPGEGKSMLMQALCDGVARGQAVGGLACTRGHALYVDCENGEREVHRRVHALGLDTSGSISIYNGLNGLRLMTDENAIDAVIASERPDLVVLDSLRKLTYGIVENDSGPMGEALAVCQGFAKRHDVAVVVIHHARKAGDAFRGTSAIEAETSMSFKFARPEGDADRTRRLLECEKCRIDREPDRRFLALVDDPTAGTMCVERTDAPTALVSGPARSSLADQILDALAERPWTRGKLAKHLGRDPKDRTVRRAFDDLEAHGIISRDETTNLWSVVAGGTPRGDTIATGGSEGGPEVADATPGGTIDPPSHPPPATPADGESAA